MFAEGNFCFQNALLGCNFTKQFESKFEKNKLVQYKHIVLHEEMSNVVGPQVLQTLVTALPLRIVATLICTYMVMATYVKICFQGALSGMKFY